MSPNHYISPPPRAKQTLIAHYHAVLEASQPGTALDIEALFAELAKEDDVEAFGFHTSKDDHPRRVGTLIVYTSAQRFPIHAVRRALAAVAPGIVPVQVAAVHQQTTSVNVPLIEQPDGSFVCDHVHVACQVAPGAIQVDFCQLRHAGGDITVVSIHTRSKYPEVLSVTTGGDDEPPVADLVASDRTLSLQPGVSRDKPTSVTLTAFRGWCVAAQTTRKWGVDLVLTRRSEGFWHR